jgi:hypothetical protein
MTEKEPGKPAQPEKSKPPETGGKEAGEKPKKKEKKAKKTAKVISPNHLQQAKDKLREKKDELADKKEFENLAEAKKWFHDFQATIDWVNLTSEEQKEVRQWIKESGLRREAEEKAKKIELPEDPKGKAELIRKEQLESTLIHDFQEYMSHLPPEASPEQKQEYLQEFFEHYPERLSAEETKIFQRMDLFQKLQRGEVTEDELEALLGNRSSFNEEQNEVIEDTFRSFRETYRAYPFGLEAILTDATREIVEVAIKNRLESGRRGKLIVKNEDIDEWMMGIVQEVVRANEEGTNQAVVTLLQPLYAVLAVKDLDFGGVIKDFSGLTELQLERMKFVGFDVEPFRRLQKSLNEHGAIPEGEHARMVSRETREKIVAILTWANASVVHEFSTLESFVSLMRRLGPVDWGRVLEAKGKKTTITGGLGFTLCATNEAWTRRALGKKKKFWGKGSERARMDWDTGTEMIADEAVLEMKIGKGEWQPGASLESYENMLPVEGEVEMQVDTCFNLITQERIFGRIISRNADKADFGREELTRQSITKTMEIVDLDGRINESTIKKIIAEQHKAKTGDVVKESDVQLRFKSKKDGKEIAGRKKDLIRAQFVAGAYKEKGEREFHNLGISQVRVKEDGTREAVPYLEGYYYDRDKASFVKSAPKGKEGERPDIYRVTGHRENKIGWETNFEELDNLFAWARGLAEGGWRIFGIDSAQDKMFEGNTLDWKTKIFQFPRYVKMYGILGAFLREVISTEYPDFITRRLTELFGGLKLGDKIYEELAKENGWPGSKEKWRSKKQKRNLKEEELSWAVKMLVTDYNGFFMGRDRALDFLESYRGIKVEQGQKVADDYLMERLISQATYYLGESHGELFAHRVFADLQKINWSHNLSKGWKEKTLRSLAEELAARKDKSWAEIKDQDIKEEKIKEAMEDLFKLLDLEGEIEGENQEFRDRAKGLLKSETTGMDGLYLLIKEDYDYGKFKWEETWQERPFKEAQYTVAAESVRHKMLSFLGNPRELKSLVEPIRAAAWFGIKDMNLKAKQMTKRVMEYFSGVGPLGRQVPARNDVDWVNELPKKEDITSEEERMMMVVEDIKRDPLDGTIDKNYRTEWAWLRTPAMQDIHDPAQAKMSFDDRAWYIKRLSAQYLLRTPRDFHELMADLTGLGTVLPYQPELVNARILQRIDKEKNPLRYNLVKAGLFVGWLPAWLLNRHVIDLPGGRTIKISNAENLIRGLRLVIHLGWEYKGVVLLGLLISLAETAKKQFEEAISEK